MEIIQLILLIAVFLTLAFLMFLRKIPALLALPVMAFLMPIISGVSFNETIQSVLGAGATRLSEAYTIAIFGSMLSVLLQKTGVAESFIKIGAELSGDKPWTITLILLILISLLFTTLGGLGAIIMVATVVLPIMASVGVGAVTTVGIFLIGLSMGGILNVGNWVVYSSVLGLQLDEVRSFAFVMLGITFVISLFYLTIQLYRDGHDINFKLIAFRAVAAIAVIAGVVFLFSMLGQEQKNSFYSVLSIVLLVLKWGVGISISLLFVFSIIRMLMNSNVKGLHWISYFTPIVPLFLILIFEVNIIAAFIVGIIYGFISTYKKNNLNLLVRSILEGGAVVMPAVALMLGIGMLLNAVIGPPSSSVSASVKLNSAGIASVVKPASFVTTNNEKDIIIKMNSASAKPEYSWSADTLNITGTPGAEVKYELKRWQVLSILKPAFSAIIPDNIIMYIVLFTLLAPLALYRGPLNVWGMGFGMAAIFLASGMNAGAIMGLLMSVGQIQGISDPTNTQNVWLANEMRVDVQKVLWNTIPYTWLAALLGLIASAFMFLS